VQEKQLVTMITSQRAFLEIAEDALAESERLGSEQARPKPGGEEGLILILDPHQQSFKQACIALIFACCYLEALLYCVGTRKFPNNWNDKKVYEKKLKRLGVADSALLDEAERLRGVRKEVVHEKAVATPGESMGEIYVAQVEAKRAVVFVKTIRDKLDLLFM